MYKSTQTKYHCIRVRIRSELIKSLTTIIAVVFCLTAPAAFAQSAGPFPGSAVDAKTLRIQERVEELYEQGDYDRAFFNYRNELAPIGDKYAQYMVGYMYLTGTGVEEDPVLASAWYRLAAERSYKEFINERDHILSLFSDVDLIRSDSLYLQLRGEYSDVVLLLELVKDDLDMLEARTGSRLSGGGGSVTIVDIRSGSSISGDRMYGEIRKRIEARLRFMGTQLDFPNLDTDPDDVDIDELEKIVGEFVATITDR
jgi:Sel1 repeat